MPTFIEIKKEDAQELIYMGDGNTSDWPELGYNLEFIENKLVDTSRWRHHYFVVFKDLDTGKFYASDYTTGATECQDESPYEYDGDLIKFYEVEPVQVTVTEYKVVN